MEMLEWESKLLGELKIDIERVEIKLDVVEE